MTIPLATKNIIQPKCINCQNVIQYEHSPADKHSKLKFQITEKDLIFYFKMRVKLVRNWYGFTGEIELKTRPSPNPENLTTEEVEKEKKTLLFLNKH